MNMTNTNEVKQDARQDKMVNLDNWESFITGSWLKASNLQNNPDTLVCIGVEGKERDNKNVVILKLEYKGTSYDFELNKGNQSIIRQFCPGNPLQCVGKKIVMIKTKRQNPQTKMMVDALEIIKVEN